MKKLRLKKGVVVGIYLIVFALTGMGAFFVSQNMKQEEKQQEPLEYVNQSIVDEENVQVINEDVKIIKPYTLDKVQIAKYYYDYRADNEAQEKSILYHENTYIQNSGMDYTSDEVFEVVAILNGVVVDVKEDEFLGKIVEIKHDNELVSSYQSLSEVSVKKNDTITQGQVIGKSGTNTIDKDLGNHLHFELYKAGQVVDPNQYFDKSITTNENQQKEQNQNTEASRKTE